MDSFKLDGLIAAPVTAFHDNGELNLSIIGKYIDVLLGQGIKHVYLNGCTGEGPSMTVEERKLAAEKWIEEGKGKLDKIIIQIGGTNLKDCQELAVHAKAIGASAIATLPPLFYKSDVSSLVEYCREIAAVVPELPFMYYHIPILTHVDIKMADFLQAAKDKIPNLVGVKFSYDDILDISQCLSVSQGKFNISIGFDEGLLSTLCIGVTSAIGSTYSYNGKLNNGIVQAFKKGNMEEAKRLQHKAREYITILIKYGGHAGVTKAFLRLCGLDTGPTRLPMTGLDQDRMVALKKDLDDSGFFEYTF